MSLSIPRVYASRYEIARPLGEGAFSRTFVARDTVLQREVALKVLRREHQSNSEFSARFDREAQAAARISHPNVVPIFDFGREDDLPFIVMQFIDGRTLRQFDREEGPLTIEEVISVGRQVLDGLAAIHDEGIIHRDIKPQNVLLDNRMVARLTDFGVAFLNNDVTLTETGTTLGTAAYMAPEQATGRTVGPPADIYSVGVMLYELLTGRLPFQGDNPVQVLYRHVSDLPPRPRDLNPRIPIELEAIILRALAKIPSDRYLDARAMRDHLSGKPPTPAAAALSETVRAEPRQFSQPAAPPAAPTRRTRTPLPAPKPHRRRLWVLPAALAIAALAIIIVAFVMSGLAGGGDDTNSAGTSPTATGVQIPGGIVSSPTATQEETVAGTSTATPTATATETAPTATDGLPTSEAEPTLTAGGSGSIPPTAFNTPFLVSSLPPVWNQGENVRFGRDDFVAGGAYRRDDGVLYNRPAAHLYAQNTEYPGTTVEFTINGDMAVASSYLGIVFVGMDDELPGKVPCRLSLNGEVIWQGESPFENEGWTRVGWQVGNLGWLKPGKNRLTFEVLVDEGDFGLPPWILLNEASVYWD